jgi:hypothetical protein
METGNQAHKDAGLLDNSPLPQRAEDGIGAQRVIRREVHEHFEEQWLSR